MQTIVILLAGEDGAAADAASRLSDRLGDATGARPEVRAVALDGAVSAGDLAAAQGADLLIVMGRSAQIDVLAGLARLRGAVVDGADTDRAALFVALEAQLGRVGLAEWLAAADAGPVALVEWARANPADPLARSAALGMTPAEHRAMVVGPGAIAASAAVSAHATTLPAAFPPGDPVGEAPAVAAPQSRIERLAGPLLVAALAVIPPLLVLLLFNTPKAEDRQDYVLLAALSALLAGLVTWRWPVPNGKSGRASYLLRLLLIAGGSLVAITFGRALVIAFVDDGATLEDFSVALAMLALAMVLAVPLLLIGVLATVLVPWARRHNRIDTLAFGSLAVLVAAVAIGAWQSFLFMSDPEKLALLETELARTGNDDCSREEADQTLEARVRVAELALGRGPTGRWSPDLLEGLEAMPSKSTFTLAADGSGDARTVPEIARKLCRAPGDVRIEVLPGSYDLTEDDKFRLNDGEMRGEADAPGRKLVIAGRAGGAGSPTFALRGLTAFGFSSSSGWASVEMSDIVFEDRPALPSAKLEAYDKDAVYFGVPAELKRVAIRSARQSAGLSLGYEGDRAQPMLLEDVQLRNGEGPALEIGGENPVAEASGEPAAPFEVKVRGGSIASQVHNPIIMTGPARLDIRDTRISSGNRDNYCISLSDKASYTASGLTMQCAGSPRGMTASEQANPQ